MKGQLELGSSTGIIGGPQFEGKWHVLTSSGTPGPLGSGGRCIYHEFIVP